MPTSTPPLRKIVIHGKQSSHAMIALPESGFYEIVIRPWRERGVYDVDYDVSWRVQ